MWQEEEMQYYMQSYKVLILNVSLTQGAALDSGYHTHQQYLAGADWEETECQFV